MLEDAVGVGRRVTSERKTAIARAADGNIPGLGGRGPRALTGSRHSEPRTDGDCAMKAREMMTQPVVTVRRNASVAEVAKAMVDHRAGCVLVVDLQGKLCGIVTQTDFGGDQHGVPFSMEILLQTFSRSISPEELEQARADARVTMVDQIMVTDVTTSTEETPLDEIARLMLRFDIDHIPVTRDGVPVGIIARHDFLRMIAEEAKPN